MAGILRICCDSGAEIGKGVEVFIIIGSFLCFGVSIGAETGVTRNLDVLDGKKVGLLLDDDGDGDEPVEETNLLLLPSDTRDT